MSRRSNEQLIHDLARDAPPVRPIPRLSSVVAWVGLVWAAGVWAVGAAGMWGLGGPLSELVTGSAWSGPGFVGVLLGMGATAVGATLAALSSAVPGRESVRGAGIAAAVVGVALATGGGLWAVFGVSGSGLPAGPQLATSVLCMGKACALGLAPVGVASLFLTRGLVRKPWLSAAGAVMGAVALGGLAMHLGCRDDGALHLLLGHALAPLLLGFALAIPVGWWIRRRQALGLRSPHRDAMADGPGL